jgi:predicted Fe-Mo cluster-binding NifX family protein
MKIGIPVMSNNASYENTICDHFGSAPFFAVVDITTDTVKIVDNRNAHHQHGMCNPLAALATENISAVVVRGIGAGAVNKLKDSSVLVFRAAAQSVKTAIDDFKAKRLEAMTVEGACAGHHH